MQPGPRPARREPFSGLRRKMQPVANPLNERLNMHDLLPLASVLVIGGSSLGIILLIILIVVLLR
jgi:hypothetical protein